MDGFPRSHPHRPKRYRWPFTNSFWRKIFLCCGLGGDEHPQSKGCLIPGSSKRCLVRMMFGVQKKTSALGFKQDPLEDAGMYTQLYLEGTSKKNNAEEFIKTIVGEKHASYLCGRLVAIHCHKSLPSTRPLSGGFQSSGTLLSLSNRINLWYIYLHLKPETSTKCIGKSTMCPHHKSQGFFRLFVCFSPPPPKKKKTSLRHLFQGWH